MAVKKGEKSRIVNQLMDVAKAARNLLVNCHSELLPDTRHYLRQVNLAAERELSKRGFATIEGPSRQSKIISKGYEIEKAAREQIG